MAWNRRVSTAQRVPRQSDGPDELGAAKLTIGQLCKLRNNRPKVDDLFIFVYISSIF
jgi:hypothetical protein